MIHKKNYSFIMSEKLPEGKYGDYSVTKGELRRGTLMRQYSPAGYFYYDHTNAKMPIVRLTNNDGIIMSDTPMEQESIRIPLVVARGKVLIIGLGLGLFPTLLRKHNKLVKSITIVEKSPYVAGIVYCHIKNKLTTLIISEGKEYLASCEEKYDFIFIDVWPELMAPIKEIEEWTELAKHCLAEGGEIRCWLQELYDRIKYKLPKEPTMPTSPAGIHEPCLVCGKTLRNDYASLCMDCADSLGVSELYVKR